jgi:aryl-alcohol dehydrogenase-like predicted oxidoreductase
MISRREWLGISLGAGATLAFTPELLRALGLQQPGKLMQRAIPSSGEMLPVIALGRGSRPVEAAALKEVLKTLVDNGGKVVDFVHGSNREQDIATAASELGIQNKLFWSVPLVGSTDPAGVRAKIESSLTTLKVPRIDLVQVLALEDVPASLFAVLRELKKEGKIRYIGVTDLLPPQNMNAPVGPRLESVMRNEPIDFVGFDYSVVDRRAEQRLLPLAQERKIGVMAYFAFDRARGLQRVGNAPLPPWAAEFDAKTWPQFFIKYALSHPAVTVVRTGTGDPRHMLDNIGGGIGRLPDEAMRKRMASFIDALPAAAPSAPPANAPPPPQGNTVVLSAAILNRYVSEWKTPGGNTITFRRDGSTLFVKPGNNPEIPLTARSETRLQDPRGPVFEFQVDASGAVTGLTLEQGNPVQRMTLTRVR